MEIKLDYSLTVDEFIEVIKSVGWKTYSKQQVKKALENTMYAVSVKVDGDIAGNEEFYKKAGFKYEQEKITGMYLWIEK